MFIAGTLTSFAETEAGEISPEMVTAEDLEDEEPAGSYRERTITLPPKGHGSKGLQSVQRASTFGPQTELMDTSNSTGEEGNGGSMDL